MPFSGHQRRKLHGHLLDSPRDGDGRCLSCGGLCCTSFADILISWDEYRRLEELGSTRLQLSLFGPHRLLIDYNCEFLRDGRCLIYEDRPDVCRRFVCRE